MNPFDFFQRRVCLTLGPDWPLAQAEFERVGLTGVQMFQALPIDAREILGPHQSFNASVRQILSEALESEADNLLFLEDDCIFQPTDHLERALSELPVDWDIVYLGANLTCCPSLPVRYSEHLFRIFGAWTTHAIGYNRRVIPVLLEGQPDFSAEMFDAWMSRDILPNVNAFCVAPMVAYQRAHVSAIWNKGHEDYTGIFDASQELLK